VFVMVRSTQVSQACVNEARLPTLTRQTQGYGISFSME
jgi:hypothetical protein